MSRNPTTQQRQCHTGDERVPRLNEYISVGFCLGYGDGDYRVSMAVCDLDRKRFDELRLAVLGALRCAEDNWRAAQADKPGGINEQACAVAHPLPSKED